MGGSMPVPVYPSDEPERDERENRSPDVDRIIDTILYTGVADIKVE